MFKRRISPPVYGKEEEEKEGKTMVDVTRSILQAPLHNNPKMSTPFH
jgi:hypothetical protein